VNIRFEGPAHIDFVTVKGTLEGPTTVTVRLFDGTEKTTVADSPTEAFAGAFIQVLKVPGAHDDVG